MAAVRLLAVRDKARGKRAALRGAATAATCLQMAGLLGCATATPSSKAQTSKACGNTITVLKQAANAADLAGTTANVEKATAATGSACADGSCAVKQRTLLQQKPDGGATPPSALFSAPRLPPSPAGGTLSAL